MNYDYDIIVVGGGHAGVEAALAAARMGAAVAIITMDTNKIALMSCNPAIGGIGKSHLVKEIDALGGLMAEAIDATGIQFRRLNLSRGPAVWSTRVQADRIKYNEYIVNFVKNHKNVDIIQGVAGKILTDNNKTSGIETEEGQKVLAKAVIICSGTFLGGLIHIGEKKIKAGRMGDKSAYSLSDSIRQLGFEVGRLKTGTPPRLDGDSIDYSRCEIQSGEEPIPFFSPHSKRKPFKQIPCYLTNTTEATKEIIKANYMKSPMFSGQINSTGPRYCPSIEDKYFRFADKDTHQIFLEPEGDGTNKIYPNGFSTGLPEDIQLEAIRTIVGLENTVITQPGYAVEYDYCPAYQVKPSLETRLLPGLFFAGQINGTSGYEEAAAQGLMAGINAVLKIRKEEPFVLDRSQAYIGVMIDDFTTRSTTEPYRLFTSRAEYRLALREDNARDRLYDFAAKYGLINEEKLNRFSLLQQETEQQINRFKKETISVSRLGELGEKFKRKDRINIEHYLKQPGVTIKDAVTIISGNGDILSDNPEVLERASIFIRYKGYIEKQQREIDKFKKLESEQIPEDFDYGNIKGLKIEAQQKFLRFKPRSLGQAGRIEGITPGDIAVLSVYLKRHKESTR